MELYHYYAREGNFGDDLNLWLWDEILPGWRTAWPERTLVGVGTLINERLPRGRPLVVLGAGCGYGELPDAEILASCRFESVRGPRSAALLGLPPERGIADPAMLLPDLAEFQGLPKARRPVFVPHHRSTARLDWAAVCASAGVDYISPGEEARAVIRRLATAPVVIAESMHAAIIADAFGTPWHAVFTSERFLPSKWQDWGDSLGVAPVFHDAFRETNRAKGLVEGIDPRLVGMLGGRSSRSSRPGLAAASVGAAAPPQAASAAPLAPTPAKPGSRAGRLRSLLKRVEAWQARRLFASLARRPGQLSDRRRLAEAQARYRDVLRRVQAEFTAGG